MDALLPNLNGHRVRAQAIQDVTQGVVHFSPAKSLWFLGMLLAAVAGGLLTFSGSAFLLFLCSTAWVLLFGHSLGSHRKLIHDSFQCPKWLEYLLVYSGTLVGLAGPLGLMRQHELRDYAQRLPTCHDYLRHGRKPLVDAWWQLCCELQLDTPPAIRIESKVAEDPIYRFLDRTWMLQQLPWALLFYAWGGWAFVFWGVCARVTAGVFGHWFIGHLAHNTGGMHYEVQRAAVQGRNVRFASLLTMGECWHNNHHAYPGSARLGLYPGEWDPGWWVLKALKSGGLVWAIRLPEDLPARPELVSLDMPYSADIGHGSDAVAAPPNLVTAWKLCEETQPIACWSLNWPGVSLSYGTMRKLVGPNMSLRLERSTCRLQLSAEGIRIMGLPAVCIALAHRGILTRIMAEALLPVALALEQLRYRLATA